MSPWARLLRNIGADGRAALVRLVDVAGSTPREAGAAMVVSADGRISGSIGGGALEHLSIAQACRMMADGAVAGWQERLSLGPALGQCCGGSATVRIDVYSGADRDWIAPLAEVEQGAGWVAARPVQNGDRLIWQHADESDARACRFGEKPTPVLVFGAGHVGRALMLALAPLPFGVTLVDSRADMLPAVAPVQATLRCEADPRAVLTEARRGTLAVVMTHSHALDLALVEAALRLDAIAFVGLIGSATKRARFVGQLRAAGLGAAGLERLVCPVGRAGFASKLPAAIAAGIAVALLEQRERT
jgi:xanthine dehydrogenase accessory factor